MQLPQFTTRQLLTSITWMCVGFGGIAFSMRKWNLPLEPDYDWLADLEPLARISALVVGWVIICAAAIALVTRYRRGAVLIAALLVMIPGAFVGAIVGGASTPDDFEYRALAGALLASVLVILGAIVPPKNVRDDRAEPVAETSQHKDA